MSWSTDSAYRVLRKDPVMKKIISTTGRLNPIPSKNLYHSLLTSVVSQQLSVKAADTIWDRVLKLFPDEIPHAEKLLKLKDDHLRSAGLSYAKAKYLKNIALFSIEQSLDYRKLYRKSDDELTEYLTSIKGVGNWTAEMILMFSLNRPNIFPISDIGIQQIMKKLYHLKSEKKILQIEMKEIAEQWTPYRSLACRHLWKYKDEHS